MPVAGAAEAVTISGDAPALDSRKTETGATYSRTELDNIPTTRDPWGVLRQVPGVLLGKHRHRRRRKPDNSPRSSGRALIPDQNTYNLDGVDVSIAGFTPLFFDFDSLDSIGIATGGSDPSLSSPGVTLNLVTKRGTNQLRGSARGLYTDGARWDYGAEVGGPLWKDHLWLWGAGASNSYLSETFFVQPTEEPVRYQETQDYWNAKLNAQLISSNTLNLSYLKLATVRRRTRRRLGNSLPVVAVGQHLSRRVVPAGGLAGLFGEVSSPRSTCPTFRRTTSRRRRAASTRRPSRT